MGSNRIEMRKRLVHRLLRAFGGGMDTYEAGKGMTVGRRVAEEKGGKDL